MLVNDNEYINSIEIKRLKSIYRNMKSRCYNKKTRGYKYYGNREIKICDEWLGTFGFFNFYIWSIKNHYRNNLTIDRIDNNKGYSPENCRWVDNFVQQNNKRNNHFIIYNGNKLTISQLSRLYGIQGSVLRNRIIRGYDVFYAVNWDERFYQKQ